MKEDFCNDIIMKRKAKKVKEEIINYIDNYHVGYIKKNRTFFSKGQYDILTIYNIRGLFFPMEIEVAKIFFDFGTANDIVIYDKELYDSLKRFGNTYKYPHLTKCWE